MVFADNGPIQVGFHGGPIVLSYLCPKREGYVAEDVKVDKSKFDALLNAMVSTPPLPKSEVKTGKRKSKKKK